MDNKDFFDGMFDFNGDGKTDLMEEGLAYQMMDDFDNQFREKSPSSSSSSSGSTIIAIIGTILVFLALGSIITACDNNSRNSTGRYSYSHSYKSYSGSSTKSNSSAYSYQSKTTSSAVQPATKKSTYKSYSSKSQSSKSEDEYSAKDYVDADDFYYDHYDDFYDYEDAEDYYNEHN